MHCFLLYRRRCLHLRRPHLVARMVERLFVYRHNRAARHLPTDEKATAVSMLREALDVQSDGTEGFL